MAAQIVRHHCNSWRNQSFTIGREYLALQHVCGGLWVRNVESIARRLVLADPNGLHMTIRHFTILPTTT